MILDELQTQSFTINTHSSFPRVIDTLEIPSIYLNVIEKMIGKWILCETESQAIEIQKQNTKSTKWNCLTKNGILYYSYGEIRKNQMNNQFHSFGFQGRNHCFYKEEDLRKKNIEKEEKERKLMEYSTLIEDLKQENNKIVTDF